MQIYGDPYKKSFSQAYKKGKMGNWAVTVYINGTKTKQTEEFETQDILDTFVRENNNKIFVNIHDTQGHVIGTEKFENYTLASTFVNENKKKEIAKLNKQEHQQKDSEIAIFEKVLNDFGDSTIIDDGGEGTPFDNSALLAKHQVEFDDMITASEQRARSLLMSVAQLYVQENIITNNDYIKYKLVIEEKGLSSLLYQLDISRKSLFKLSEQIQTGMHSPRNYEVLTGLQRIVLDVTKYLHEHLESLQASFKELSEKLNEENPNQTTTTDTIETTAVVLETRSRATLIEEIKDIIEESKKYKTPQSHNDNLKVEDDGMTDAVKILLGDDDDVDDDNIDSKLGLDTV